MSTQDCTVLLQRQLAEHQRETLLSEMSLSCFQPADPNIINVDRLYDNNSEEGHLFVRNGTHPVCSSTSPPTSGCVACLHQAVHIVCSNLLKNMALVMEEGGRQIGFTKTECPRLLGDGAWTWWPLILTLLVVIMIFLLSSVVIRHLRKRQTGVNSAGESSEMKPVAV